MKTLVFVTWLTHVIGVILCNQNYSTNGTLNFTDPNKDLYVIHAMVYQVGILTNKTDDKHPNATMGNQEALTLYRNKGSKIDLSSIPTPLLTNVTAQSVVQVAPKDQLPEGDMGKSGAAWSDIGHLVSLPENVPNIKTGIKDQVRSNRSIESENGLKTRFTMDDSSEPMTPSEVFTRSVDFRDLFKRELPDNRTTVKVVKGGAVIPQAAGVQSIAIPPLLTLNNNLSNIPVPIPNTSVVHYAKINTLVRNP